MITSSLPSNGGCVLVLCPAPMHTSIMCVSVFILAFKDIYIHGITQLFASFMHMHVFTYNVYVYHVMYAHWYMHTCQ